MHWIQRYILEQLLYTGFLRNRDLRPPKVESNLFQYHLKQLARDGWVAKQEKRYTLGPKGLAWADHYSSTLRGERPQSKFVSVIIITNEKNEFLLLPRSRQPFVGSLTLPSGKIKKGELLKKAARRELYEKTSLEGISLHQDAAVRSVITLGGQIITDYIGMVWRGSVTDCRLPGSFTWLSEQKVHKDDRVFPGIAELLCQLATGNQHIEIIKKL